MSGMAAGLRARGLPIREVSAGSTPQAFKWPGPVWLQRYAPVPISLGTGCSQKENCAAVEDIAVRLYATVVSTPAPDYAVLDGGTKTFPWIFLWTRRPSCIPDMPFPSARTANPMKPAASPHERGARDSHRKNGRTGLRVGQVLELIPIHVCTAVNMQNSVFVLEDGALRRMPVEARGMLV